MKTKRPWGVHVIGDLVAPPGVQAGLPGGRWVRAVPEPYSGNRIVAAWWVLTGRAHAVVWPEPGDLERAIHPDRIQSPRAPTSGVPPRDVQDFVEKSESVGYRLARHLYAREHGKDEGAPKFDDVGSVVAHDYFRRAREIIDLGRRIDPLMEHDPHATFLYEGVEI
jgi:hypothetical protein